MTRMRHYNEGSELILKKWKKDILFDEFKRPIFGANEQLHH